VNNCGYSAWNHAFNNHHLVIAELLLKRDEYNLEKAKEAAFKN
jgi:hypothetical protein